MTSPYFKDRQVVDRVGFKWFLDTKNLIDFAIVNHAGVWEPYSTEVVKRIARPGWVCADIGANLGYYTLLLSRLTSHVHAFEPMHEPRALLQRHLAMNGIANVTVHGLALGDAPCRGERREPYAFTMAEHARCAEQASEVETRTLDGMDLGRLDFLKIDVDGHDFAVLRGAAQTLRAYDPVILVEVGEATLRKVEGASVRDLMVWLYHAGSHGYDFFYEYDMTQCLSPEALQARIDLNKYTSNLLAMPRGMRP